MCQTEVERTGIHEALRIDAEGKIARVEDEMSKLVRELEEIEREKTKLVEQSYECVLRLKNTALKIDTDSVCKVIGSLIEMLKTKNEPEKVETLQKMLGDAGEEMRR